MPQFEPLNAVTDTVVSLPEDTYQTAIALPAALAELVQRAWIVGKQHFRIDEKVRVSLVPGKIIVEATALPRYRGDRDRATFAESIAAPDQTATAKFAIHPEFLLAILGILGADVVKTSCILGEQWLGFGGANWTYLISLRH